MREIKFRAWIPHEHRMTYGDITDYGIIDIGKSEGTLMQFTGLLDKNGKEIYEGDILTMGDIPVMERDYPSEEPYIYNSVVYWDDKDAGFFITKAPFHTYDHRIYFRIIDRRQAWICGNIYENPNVCLTKEG
jgi:uncharacterized phage protein (TIGR01671 family)